PSPNKGPSGWRRGHPAESNPGTGEPTEVGAVPPHRESQARSSPRLNAKGRLSGGGPSCFTSSGCLLRFQVRDPGVELVDLVLQVLDVGRLRRRRRVQGVDAVLDLVHRRVERAQLSVDAGGRLGRLGALGLDLALDLGRGAAELLLELLLRDLRDV